MKTTEVCNFNTVWLITFSFLFFSCISSKIHLHTVNYVFSPMSYLSSFAVLYYRFMCRINFEMFKLVFRVICFACTCLCSTTVCQKVVFALSCCPCSEARDHNQRHRASQGSFSLRDFIWILYFFSYKSWIILLECYLKYFSF